MKFSNNLRLRYTGCDIDEVININTKTGKIKLIVFIRKHDVKGNWELLES